MINQEPSSPAKRWKFLLVLPLIAVFLLSFNKKEVLRYSYANAEEVSAWEVSFISPLATNQINRITSGFGPAKNPFNGNLQQHKGIDLSAKTGVPVYASADGLVQISDYNEKNGEYLRLEHQEGYATRYLHLQKRMVEKGQSVKMGDLIGFVGSTGLSTGPHLHFEILLNDNPQDPLGFIDFGQAEERYGKKVKAKKPKTAQGGINTVRQPRKPMEGVKSIDLIINSTTTDAELQKIKSDLAKDGIDFSYTVVRNDDKEIISIELSMNGKGENGAQFNGNYNLNGEEPISPIAIHYDDQSNQISFGNMEYKGKRIRAGNTFVIRGDRNGGEKEEQIIILNGDKTHTFKADSIVWKSIGDSVHFETIDIEGGAEKVIRLTDKHKVIRIKGDLNEDEIIHLNPKEEVEVEVIRIEDKDEKGKHKSKRRKRKKRVKESETDGSRVVIRTNSSDSVRVKVISDTDNEFVVVRNNGDKEPMYIVDGKVVDKDKMIQMNPDKIESINILKGESAKELYGRKGKNGVVVINTKK